MRSSFANGTIAVAAAGLAIGGAAYASLYPTSQIFGPVLVAGDDPGELALTYDDGPNPAATPRLLEVLESYGIKATFFLIGDFVRQERNLAREVAAAGHVIGNHSMTHPRLAWQPAQRVRQELKSTSDLLEDVIGVPVHYFRPPYGARRPYVMRAATDLGMTTVQWNVAASDWNPIGAEAIAANVRRGIERNRRRGRGSNILLHDGGHLGLGANRQATVAATAELLHRYASHRFVTVGAWV